MEVLPSPSDWCGRLPHTQKQPVPTDLVLQGSHKVAIPTLRLLPQSHSPTPAPTSAPDAVTSQHRSFHLIAQRYQRAGIGTYKATSHSQGTAVIADQEEVEMGMEWGVFLLACP